MYIHRNGINTKHTSKNEGQEHKDGMYKLRSLSNGHQKIQIKSKSNNLYRQIIHYNTQLR